MDNQTTQASTEHAQSQKKGPGMGMMIGIIVIIVLVVGGWYFSRHIPVPGVGSVNKSLDGSTTYNGPGGSVTVNGGSYPAEWPADAPRYRNGTIQTAGSANPTSGGAGQLVIFSTTDSVDQVFAFYHSELTKNGWTVSGTARTAGYNVLSATKDTRTLALSASTSEGKTVVQVAIGTGGY